MSCTVLVPAAGNGERFQSALYAGEPLALKPFIKFSYRRSKNKTMLEHALDDAWSWNRVIGLSEERSLPDGMAGAIVGKTEGQADTVWRMLSRAEPGVPVMVHNSDMKLLRTLWPFHQFMRHSFFEAGVVVAEDSNPAFSYVDSAPLFFRGVEKQAISKWAITGAFWFRDSDVLYKALEALLSSKIRGPNGEAYLSDALSFISGQKYAYVIPRENWIDFGTPEALFNNPDVVMEEEHEGDPRS